jgi:tRNA (guanine37-N1)-methyltransferase
MKKIDVVTLFPELIELAVRYGVTRRVFDLGLVDLALHNPRQFSQDVHHTVDDRPYGGGPGMLMLAEPLELAIMHALDRSKEEKVRPHVVYFSPQGSVLDHEKVLELAARDHIIFIAGRYEGIDERVIDLHVDEELSIGDYVLSGGELPILVTLDAMFRHFPGVLHDPSSAVEDSFASGLLDCPHYTRPESFRGLRVPDVLLSGHHKKIALWRKKQSLGRTWLRRPDILAQYSLTQQEAGLLTEFQQEHVSKNI